jgi:hypothetical protein
LLADINALPQAQVQVALPINLDGTVDPAVAEDVLQVSL